MKKELDLSYKVVKKMPPRANDERCLVLRQQYALKMLELLQQRRHVVNVDETWVNESNFIRRAWTPKDHKCNASL